MKSSSTLTFAFAAALATALFVSSPAAAAMKVDPDKVDLNIDVKKLDMEGARLYRGAIMARHCHFFEDSQFRGAFKEYQREKCPPDMYFGDPAGDFDVSVLSADEKAFFKRLGEREKELKANSWIGEGKDRRYNPNVVVNRSQFDHLEKKTMDRLFEQGFVVVPGENMQLFQVYEENDYRLVPSFITTDTVLQLYHMYFDFTLREVEEKKLLPAARELALGMGRKMDALYRAETDPANRAALARCALYFAVASDLLGQGPLDDEGEESVEAMLARPAPEWLDPSLHEKFAAQRKLILEGKGAKFGPVMGTVDYTMFKPRGHYTRSAALERYFRAMTWFGLPGFVLDEKYMPTESALAMVYELVNDPAMMEKYELIYEPTSFYVGPTDDITPYLVRDVAEEICGKSAPLGRWLAMDDKIRETLIERDPTRIRPMYNDDRGRPQVKFMGMRYTPDSDILQKLVDIKYRQFPAGLDVFAVMKVPAALSVLKEHKPQWDGYWPAVAKLQSEFEGFKPKTGESNLYWRWMGLLKTLNAPSPAGAPPFMHHDAWGYKNLSTSLASWAELRHDTILYNKPSGAECGGGEMPPRTVGYVEARPDFFGELVSLQRFTRERLDKRGLLTDKLKDTGERMAELFSFLEKTSAKEVRGEPLTKREYEDIRLFGSNVEYLTIELLLDDRFSMWADVQGPDKSVAVVADVHTFEDEVLEEAVGLADEIYVLAEVEGYLYIMRGAVFSYYEFKQPASDRLTDEQWQEMLKRGKAPDRPWWMNKFMEYQAPSKPTDPYLYSSGC